MSARDDILAAVRRAVPLPRSLPVDAARATMPGAAKSRVDGFVAAAEATGASVVQVKAAELLGMSFRSFRYYVKKYNLR